jgi:PPOX class probable F420-dependent enzyme
MATRVDAGRPVPIPESHRDILEKKGYAHVATLGPHGEPESNPVWYGWDGEALKFSNTKGRQKYRNLRRNPHIAVSITDPDNPYRYLEIRGIAEIEDDQTSRSSTRCPGSTWAATTPGASRARSA